MYIIHIYLYIYKKLSPKWKFFSKNKKCFSSDFTSCVIIFSNIGPIIKKIPNFVNDPLNSLFIKERRVFFQILSIINKTNNKTKK